jgi:hypothetical protein
MRRMASEFDKDFQARLAVKTATDWAAGCRRRPGCSGWRSAHRPEALRLIPSA